MSAGTLAPLGPGPDSPIPPRQPPKAKTAVTRRRRNHREVFNSLTHREASGPALRVTTRILNVPGTGMGRGCGWSAVAGGAGVRSEVGRYTVPLRQSMAIV